MQNITFVLGSTWPKVQATLDTKANNNLTDAVVVMHLINQAGTQTYDFTMTVVDGPTGQVEYNWLASDIVNAGVYWVQFQCTLPSTAYIVLPTDTRINMVVLPAETV